MVIIGGWKSLGKLITGGWNKTGGRNMDGIENRKHRLQKAILKISIHVQFVFHKPESSGKSKVQFLKYCIFSFSGSLNLIIGGLE